MNVSYQRLIEEHDAIDTLVRRIEAEVDTSGPSIPAISALLADLSLAVSNHLSVEDRSVYTRLIVAKDKESVRVKVDFEEAFQALRADWLAYLADWTSSDNVELDWDTFVNETRAMMPRLRQRVREETNLIYPVALHLGFIRLRDHAT